MARRALALGIAAGLVSLAGAAAGASITAKPTSTTPLDRALAGVVSTPNGPPGAIAIIQRGHRRTVHTAGVADVRTRRKPRPSDHVRLASVSKAFSGAVALALVQRGRLSLGDTIGRRLPDLPSAWSRVTLRQLLNHTSGVPSFTTNQAYLARVQAAPRTPLPPRRLLDFVADRPLVFPAGSRMGTRSTRGSRPRTSAQSWPRRLCGHPEAWSRRLPT
jgi:D-alanyl-D-alanine carboxypeptidase